MKLSFFIIAFCLSVISLPFTAAWVTSFMNDQRNRPAGPTVDEIISQRNRPAAIEPIKAAVTIPRDLRMKNGHPAHGHKHHRQRYGGGPSWRRHGMTFGRNELEGGY